MALISPTSSWDLVDESVVQALWEQQSFGKRCLEDAKIQVIYRGMPSDAGGPDYQGALIVSGGQRLVEGDVEFHVRSKDWYRHAHHLDRNYNSVVLHVVWAIDGGDTVRQDGERVPTVALQAGVELSSLFETGERHSRLMAHPCVSAFARLSSDQLDSEIIDAGMLRLTARAELYRSEALEMGFDQTLYAAILEALGYASNRTPFRNLADAVPYGWLTSVAPRDRLPCLLEAAGLGPGGEIAPPARLDPETWRLTRLRPNNHPRRRIAGIVAIVEKYGPRLAETLLSAAMDAKGPHDIRAILIVNDSSGALIGAGRADEIAVSVLLPLAQAFAPGHERVAQLYRRYPCLPSNRWTRFMVDLVREAGHSWKPTLAVHHQGLHYMYHQYCRRGKGDGCRVCHLLAP